MRCCNFIDFLRILREMMVYFDGKMYYNCTANRLEGVCGREMPSIVSL